MVGVLDCPGVREKMLVAVGDAEVGSIGVGLGVSAPAGLEPAQLPRQRESMIRVEKAKRVLRFIFPPSF